MRHWESSLTHPVYVRLERVQVENGGIAFDYRGWRHWIPRKILGDPAAADGLGIAIPELTRDPAAADVVRLALLDLMQNPVIADERLQVGLTYRIE